MENNYDVQERLGESPEEWEDEEEPGDYSACGNCKWFNQGNWMCERTDPPEGSVPGDCCTMWEAKDI